ncbi:MAG TPA: sigma-70 family RNA polymerase sigma factor [Acidimicrobiales bacterium]|nr:sigma-70 family RNA polymerase sigma factor [Acidimicrobiales bacterium]
MAFDLLRSNSSAAEPEWDELYRRHAPDLRRLIARRVPLDAPVDDLLQEVFYQAYRSRHRVDLSEPAWPWLATIAHRVSIAWWRRRRPDGAIGAVDVRGGSEVVPGSDEHVAAILEGERVSTALARLSPRHRFLLVSHAADELSCERLARAEGSSAKAVKSALGRARTHFRRHMEGLPAAAVACRRWCARHQRVAPVAEGVGPWVGAVVTLGVVATLSVAPVAMRAEGRDRPADGPDAAGAVDRPAVAGASGHGPGAPVPAPAAGRGSQRPSASASAPPGASPARTGTAVAAAVVGTNADVRRSPEGTWTVLDVHVHNPVAGDGVSVGATVRCTSGALAGAACAVGRALPAPE